MFAVCWPNLLEERLLAKVLLDHYITDYSRLTIVELRNELRKCNAKISGRMGEHQFTSVHTGIYIEEL